MEERTTHIVLVVYSKCMQIRPIQIIERSKKSDICIIRNLYFKLRYEMHGESYTAIGRETGRYYTTVRSGIESINKLLSYNKEVLQMWNCIKSIPGFYLSSSSSKYAAST